jgi:hypothetical protein
MMLATPAWSRDSAQLPSETTAGDDQSTEEDTPETIVVTARRRTLDNAISIKKNADTIVGLVTAEEAGRLPDNSITEVLQRVPGVGLLRFSASNTVTRTRFFPVLGEPSAGRPLSRAAGLFLPDQFGPRPRKQIKPKFLGHAGRQIADVFAPSAAVSFR